MPRFLVEVYAPIRADSLPPVVARARRAANKMSREGTPIRHLRATLIPEDETCFHLFEAPSMEAVGEASRRAGLPVARVVAVVESGTPRSISR
jgi:hypothetical protein